MAEPKSLNLEVAVFCGPDAVRAQNLGARRVEINAEGSYDVGGTTPSLGEIKAVAPRLNIPMRIMIRPRGKPSDGPDFIYTDSELQLMRQAIITFKEANIMNPVRGDGFVFGILKHHPSVPGMPAVDIERCSTLVAAAKPFPCIFHRAYDVIAASPHAPQGLEDIITSGFEGLLTAGGEGNAADNTEHLVNMCQAIRGRTFQIVVGGGVRASNVAAPIRQFATLRHPPWMHTACIRKTAKYPGGELDTDALNLLLATMGLVKPE